MAASFTPSNVVEMSKEKEWAAALGLLDWDNTSIIFTKRSLIEFLKYTGTTVDTNLQSISKLPSMFTSSPLPVPLKFASGYAKFGQISTPISTSESAPAVAPSTSTTTAADTEGYKPSRRVRQAPGGGHSDIFGTNDEDDALAQAPPKEVDVRPGALFFVHRFISLTIAQDFESVDSQTVPQQEAPADDEHTGINFTSHVKPSRRVRTVPGGTSSLSNLWDSNDQQGEFKPTRRWSGQHHRVNGVFIAVVTTRPSHHGEKVEFKVWNLQFGFSLATLPDRCMSSARSVGPRLKMLYTKMSVTFLGTSSGGGPSASRNCSSLVADLLGNGTLWMIDCAEGTLRQFQMQPFSPARSNPRLSQVKKIFITHMHADHIMGIVPLLRNVLFPVPVGGDATQLANLRKPGPSIEIYGPAGIRNFIRSVLNMTFTKTADKYVVHELLTPTDGVTSCEPLVMHGSEIPGQDILCSSSNGLWKDVTQQKGVFGTLAVDAGPILHREPCIGYIFRETVEPFRKIVILGDTYAHIPQEIDPKAKRSYETVKEKTLARGHSMPEMAGTFAKAIGAKNLVLNHIGGRFPAPDANTSYRLKGVRANVITEIERQASEAWGMGTARAAWDFMHVTIPALESSPQDVNAHELSDLQADIPHNNTRSTSDGANSREMPSGNYERKRGHGNWSSGSRPNIEKMPSGNYGRGRGNWNDRSSSGIPDIDHGSRRTQSRESSEQTTVASIEEPEGRAW
ncbi:hypothetical protein D9757_008283 [Collybiopsis confluens]|uniref:Metallo-beta-lactamase domain-containing protein n=1 Tax=Collybiopsis confluens TaxID=2823264 RepID=A0A8H5M097_9AGAR|nr:hypothetical protein D9757_008283 [Collybiopsis confluens]